jgi:transcriptional regulator with XRE-family HTH domain
MVATRTMPREKKTSASRGSFGHLLSEKRVAKGLTQQELGDLAEMPQSIVSRLERTQKANPTLETIEKLAKALGCSPRDLIPEPDQANDHQGDGGGDE